MTPAAEARHFHVTVPEDLAGRLDDALLRLRRVRRGEQAKVFAEALELWLVANATAVAP